VVKIVELLIPQVVVLKEANSQACTKVNIKWIKPYKPNPLGQWALQG